MEVPISESVIFWEILIQLIEEGQVIPVVGRDLLNRGRCGWPEAPLSYLAEKLAASLGVSPENCGR